jgi:endonuclease YncB( thermonuclease family)
MKQIFTVLFTMLLCLSTKAQDGSPEFYKICGDPTMESTLNFRSSGKVVDIIDGDTLVIKSNNKRRIIDLVTVDASSNNSNAKEFLFKKILKKNVFFLVTGNGKSDDAQIFADVFYKDISINRKMITTGTAQYKKPASYTFSNYKSCVYQQLEEIAKKEKLGIWAK